MVRTYGLGNFDISKADSMGIPPIEHPGRPGEPIIDPIRDDPPEPSEPITVDQTEDEDAYYGEDEEGQSILDGIGLENGDNGNAFLDDYALIGLIALTAIGVTLLG
jgi:hypothetical protein